MKVKMFTFQYSGTGGFDDAPLARFIEDKQVLSVHEHFFVHELVPVWAVLVTYRDDNTPKPVAKLKESSDVVAAELPAEDRGLYEILRKWRNEKARQLGNSAYVILLNRVLGDIARNRPKNLQELANISGIGSSKTNSFGAEILAIVASYPPGATDAGSTLEKTTEASVAV